MMKNLFLASFISGLILSGAQAESAKEMKIGVVDMQKALQGVDAGKKAKLQLEKDFNAKKKELDTEKTSIEKMGEEFKKQSLVMSDEARAKKQGEIQEKILKFQEMTARSQAEIQRKEHELTQPIIGRLREVISELAKQKGYSMVFEKNENTVLYSLDKDDLTNDVINGYTKQKQQPKG
ncbi:MAG: OmpH family outer membrane protein [Bdellovibrionota bacterium]